ncbi:hypothetical protein OESDEN_01071 [Oesophagostomum dentatum]|uniref:G-protein coupled receptors family 1 profile domain-containing protein n=1 Tax=Oesophagostomum dentatum TaxID=61180 RepID=A0A0B1TSX9_OESDE|nr:hypothetical protein OESDEN_01071 [Oesophagostomum dentatum]
MGVLATPSYVAYAVLTVILAFDRFIKIHCPQYDLVFFSGATTKLWVGLVTWVWLMFAFCLASPWASMIYRPREYCWNYDDGLKFSYLVQKCEMIIELSTILLSGVFYILIVIALYRKRKRFFSQSNFRSEAKILVQAFTITVYGVVMNFLWHNPKGILPPNVWSHMTLNMMWILSAGIYPLVFFISNRAIRDNGPTVSRVTMLRVVAQAIHSKQ